VKKVLGAAAAERQTDRQTEVERKKDETAAAG
jgi:hypothetical protein